MRGTSFMLIAGEPSGDLLAAELVTALRRHPALLAQPAAPRFLGAGGPQLAAAGTRLTVDLTQHAVVGLTEVLRRLLTFRRLFHHLLHLAREHQPEVIIGVDYSGFNRRLFRALRAGLKSNRRPFHNWNPLLVQYVSPQVWASRPGRAFSLAQDLDLLLCLFPFETPWYARHTPGLDVAFVGHPLVERHQAARKRLLDPALSLDGRSAASSQPETSPAPSAPSTLVLLPGSRVGELHKHLPPMLEAARLLRARHKLAFRLVVPSESLLPLALAHLVPPIPELRVECGTLAEALSTATVALACTGTVTLECALFRVPTVALYRTSWSTYQVARRLVTVPFLAMPNLLANEALFPEFIQDAATPAHLADALSALLADPNRRVAIQQKLDRVVASLGGPGASARAADAILRRVPRPGAAFAG